MNLATKQRLALRARLQLALARGLKPLSRYNLVEWCDEFRQLSSEASAMVGPWKTASVEVARGPMLAVTDPTVHTVTLMACTQLMKTELINNTAAYFIDQDPAPILVIQPTDKLGSSWSKDRFDKMRNVTPPLKKAIKDARSRDSGNTISHKEFPGGHLTVVGANSPVDLASRPIRIVLADEIDKYPPSAGNEGDPLSLAEERAATFWNRKSIRCCSPTVKDFSRIETEYEAGDQRKPFVKCPHCGHAQIMVWRNVKWGRDEEGRADPSTAEYHCEDCGAAWPENVRMRMMRTEGAVEWRQTKPFRCCGAQHYPLHDENPNKGAARVTWDHRGYALCPMCEKPAPFEGHASFWASKLYSPWERLERIVRKWLDAQGNNERLKVFANTQLAETWEEVAEEVDPQSLEARTEDWGSYAPVPVLVVTAGVDVQAYGLEVERVGWGMGEESWSLDHRIIYGDASSDDLWQELDEYLLEPTKTLDGRDLDVACACVDSGGHHTQAVYNFCLPRFGRKVFAIKGFARGGERRPVWPKRATKNAKTGLNLFIIGVDAGKDMVLGRLAQETEGAGYCHFPKGRDSAYFAQLTAEKVRTVYVKGFPRREYFKRDGVRNEALDIRVYAYAALEALKVNWGRLAANTWPDGQMPDPDTLGEPDAPTPPPKQKLIAPQQPRFRRSRRL